MSAPADYTVGWICALHVEYVAAQVFLDEEHERPSFVLPNDTNDYTLGKISGHNVVVAVLPDGEYGTASAANVATNMLGTFPNVRIGLVVGIGGGAPSVNHDIRLGDVVVSSPHGRETGVFQYDFGKSIQDESFQYTRSLNQPPTMLRTAVTGLKSQYTIKGNQLEETVNRILEKYRRLRSTYGRPPPGSDRLFKPEVVHDPRGCVEYCVNDPSNVIQRPERTPDEDNTIIHYGLIASANQLMKNAMIRDRLAAGKDVLCFETEAAGLMNTFPCLVIRGICDYSDSHKNKGWQGYAAMVAAAYAKDLLCRIAPNKVEAEGRIRDLLSGLQEVVEVHKDIAQKHLDIEENKLKRKRSSEQEECHQLFRLTSGTTDATYEWYKGHVEARVPGTCGWLLNHKDYRRWLEQESGPLLVSADPGCGKSVLAKYLIDEGLPRSATICYFFFKDQDQNTVCQALCAILHQLFSQKPSLITHAMEEFKKNGPGLTKSTNSLWAILGKAVQNSQAEPVIIVLDALDECAELEFRDLVQNIEIQFRDGQSSPCKVKYLLTSRPYEWIVCRFMGLRELFQYIHIPGEEESAAISQEVNIVIQYRVEQLAKEKRLSSSLKDHIEKRFLEIPHRTYLWVYLVFDYLTSKDFKRTPNGVDSTIETLPINISDAYERILNKSKEHPMVRRALSIILAASRPLNLSEMNIALNVDITMKSIHDLDLEEEEDFTSRLRTWCGLFVSIHHNKIYFIHQTAREFLLGQSPSPTEMQSGLRWQQSITNWDAHKVLAQACVVYLDFLNTDVTWAHARAGNLHALDLMPFLNYSSRNWGIHYRKGNISADADIVPSTLRICDQHSKSHSIWLPYYLWLPSHQSNVNCISLMIACHFGLDTVVRILLEMDNDIEAKDNDGRTPLSWAAESGHDHVVKLLLENGANVRSKDKEYSRTPLLWAVRSGHEVTAKLLLEKDNDIDSKDNENRTALSWAAENGNDTIVNLLLRKGANLELKDKEYSSTPLLWAVTHRHKIIVKMLIEKGADFESKDNHGRTPLLWAAKKGHDAVFKLLLEEGADFESKDNHGRTSLSWAAENGHDAIVKLLIKKRAELESKSHIHGTPLLETGWDGESEADGETEFDSESEYAWGERTPLSFAAASGHYATVKLLVEQGADFNSRDDTGMTPLTYAVCNREEAITQLFLDKGADFELQDDDGRTPLSWAAENGHDNIIRLLLGRGAVNSRDTSGTTPLTYAALNKNKDAVKLFIDNGSELMNHLQMSVEDVIERELKVRQQ